MTQRIGFNQQVTDEVFMQAKEGELYAFETIYKTYFKACISLAYRLSSDHQLSQDIVHDAFIKVMKKIISLRERSSLGSWIKRIVTNEAINKLKANNRVEPLTECMQLTISDKSIFDHQWLDNRHDLDVLMVSLSPISRAVLILHEIEGLSHEEISGLFNKSISFSKVTLSRAYAVIKQVALKQEEVDAFIG